MASVADSHADSLAAAFHQGWLGAPVTDFLKAQPWAIAPDSHTSGHSSGCQHPLVFRVSIKTSDTPPPITIRQEASVVNNLVKDLGRENWKLLEF